MDPPCLRYSFWLCETNVYKTYFIYEVDFFGQRISQTAHRNFLTAKLRNAIRSFYQGLFVEFARVAGIWVVADHQVPDTHP